MSNNQIRSEPWPGMNGTTSGVQREPLFPLDSLLIVVQIGRHAANSKLFAEFW